MLITNLPNASIPVANMIGSVDGAHMTAVVAGTNLVMAADGSSVSVAASPVFTGLIYESFQDNIVAAVTQTQAAATAMTADLNRIITVATAGNGVRLPASGAGLTVIVENAGANAMQVYGAGTDTINGVATATGVSQMAGSVVLYTCYTAGAWFANGLGTGYSGSLETQSNVTGLTARAGGGQGSATPMTAMMNQITVCATTGDSGLLPASAAGLQITVINNGAASLNVFPPSGSTMNGTLNAASALATGSVGIYFSFSSTAWVSK